LRRVGFQLSRSILLQNIKQTISYWPDDRGGQHNKRQQKFCEQAIRREIFYPNFHIPPQQRLNQSSRPFEPVFAFSRPFEPVFASPLYPSSPASLRRAAAAACAGCWRGALRLPGWRFAHWGARWHGVGDRVSV